MTKKRKILTGVLSIGLVAAISVGFSLSYLTDKTESRVNNFTYPAGSKSIAAMLTEDKWDGIKAYTYDNDGNITGGIFGWDIDGNPITTRPAGNYGIDNAKNLLPGGDADKNPVITNTGKITDVRTAAKISFVYSSTAGVDKAGKLLSTADLAALMDVLEIDYNTTSWTRKSGETENNLAQTFYYNGVLAKVAENAAAGTFGGSTTPLFTKVGIKSGATTEQMNKLTAIGGFAIFIEGFCIQSNVVADDTAWLNNADTYVTFANSPTDSVPGTGYTPTV